ncbi:MAG: hypothetical protein IPF72_18195 [Chitinophagaceae bacterium]|nr:hypothetical protein [Chitinophagaceae bacterium]
MQYITVFDYLLLPVYLYIFYIIVKKTSVKCTDPELRKYFFMAFYLHMFGAVAYALMVQYYYGYGDSFVFYYGSDFLSTQISQDAGNIQYFFKPASEVKLWYDEEVGDLHYSGYFGIASNLFIMKVAAVLSLFSFNKYLIITLFFGAFSFAGLWKLFLVFKDINKDKHLKLLAWGVLYMPSVWFWGSGLMKDSVCLGGIGFIIHYMYRLFIKKEFSVKSIIALIALIYIVGNIKSYIIIVLAIGLAVFVFYKFVTPFKNVVIRGFIILIFLTVIITVAFVTNFGEQLQELADESKVQVDAYQRNYDAVQNEDERSRGSVKSGEIDASITGLILHSPIAIFTCLFRPFIWESRKIFILFSSFESLLLLLCTVYVIIKLRFLGFFREVFNNPYILTSFFIAVLFALIIGFTTYNFGTMARYKIVLLPFYFFTLVYLYTIYSDKPKKPV